MTSPDLAKLRQLAAAVEARAGFATQGAEELRKQVAALAPSLEAEARATRERERADILRAGLEALLEAYRGLLVSEWGEYDGNEATWAADKVLRAAAQLEEGQKP